VEERRRRSSHQCRIARLDRHRHHPHDRGFTVCTYICYDSSVSKGAGVPVALDRRGRWRPAPLQPPTGRHWSRLNASLLRPELLAICEQLDRVENALLADSERDFQAVIPGILMIFPEVRSRPGDKSAASCVLFSHPLSAHS
jgi:hypothetical protein